MKKFDENKFYILDDVRGFRARTGANTSIEPILSKLGPFSPRFNGDLERITGFVLVSGELVTSAQIEKEHNLRCSFHINNSNEFEYFKECAIFRDEDPNEIGQPESLPKFGSIPTINLTIRNQEEAEAAIEMLKGLF